ncbi:hypothetical protein ACKP2L_05160 [Oenococcus alcoholitolerans]|uniref:hypothetical protein n=1 Tax=Oenococcus alcoholitolerans TaxID=931074 RepID=UPI003F6F782C
MNIDSDDLLKELQPEPELYCPICWQFDRVSRIATDWHHLSHKTLGSMGGRKEYFQAGDIIVPLCRIHHSELHSLGRKRFEAKYGPLFEYELDKWQAEERNQLHYKHKAKHKNRGMR